MGVFNNGINFESIGSAMGYTALQWMNATIQIVDPNLEDIVWDEWTNTETGGEPTVLWSGPARIQHLKSESIPVTGFSQISIRGIRVQIPLEPATGFIRKGLQIIVTDGGNDYELEQLQFIITSAINSSYAWLRTIEAEVDVKSVANSTWSSISGKVSSNNIAINGATVRTFHHEDNLWIMDYETTTDSLGNYEIPADANVPVAVVVSASGYVTKYYNNATSFNDATLITPTNHVQTQNINFSLLGA